MDEIIISGILFLSFLITGIVSWALHCRIKRELLKLTNDYYLSKEEAIKYTILTPLFYFKSFNVSVIILYFVFFTSIIMKKVYVFRVHIRESSNKRKNVFPGNLRGILGKAVDKIKKPPIRVVKISL
jgi:hypothetical protein